MTTVFVSAATAADDEHTLDIRQIPPGSRSIGVCLVEFRTGYLVGSAQAYQEAVSLGDVRSIKILSKKKPSGMNRKIEGAPHALQSVIRQSTHGIAAHEAASCVLQPKHKVRC